MVVTVRSGAAQCDLFDRSVAKTRVQKSGILAAANACSIKVERNAKFHAYHNSSGLPRPVVPIFVASCECLDVIETSRVQRLTGVYGDPNKAG